MKSAFHSLSREDLATRFPEARQLSVYDGQRLLGFVIDREKKGEVFAFDADDRALGAFADRKAAVAAVGGGLQ